MAANPLDPIVRPFGVRVLRCWCCWNAVVCKLDPHALFLLACLIVGRLLSLSLATLPLHIHNTTSTQNNGADDDKATKQQDALSFLGKKLTAYRHISHTNRFIGVETFGE